MLSGSGSIEPIDLRDTLCTRRQARCFSACGRCSLVLLSFEIRRPCCPTVFLKQATLADITQLTHPHCRSVLANDGWFLFCTGHEPIRQKTRRLEKGRNLCTSISQTGQEFFLGRKKPPKHELEKKQQQ